MKISQSEVISRGHFNFKTTLQSIPCSYEFSNTVLNESYRAFDGTLDGDISKIHVSFEDQVFFLHRNCRSAFWKSRQDCRFLQTANLRQK